MAKRWRKDQITYLKRYAKTKNLEELTTRFRTEESAVRQKLTELGLQSKDGQGYEERRRDPLLGHYEKAIKALYRQKWDEAAKLLEKVVVESDQLDLVARARMHLEACPRQGEEVPEAEDDPYLMAVVAKNQGDLESAMELCSRGGRRGKDERFAYLAASIHALAGEPGEAMKLLNLAIEMNPKNRVHAYHDPDFESLRQSEEFTKLFERG